MNRLAVVLATAGGAGYAPIAPGTFGSLVGLFLYLATHSWPLVWQWGLLAVIVVVGVWASTVAERQFSQHDPGPVVIDEVAGQLVTLIMTGAGVGGAIVGFFVFRALDIVKPPPANQLERLRGGYGIMADDLMAGVYGNLIMQVFMRLAPEGF
jgi:phosphatidylglycerophosphatase A